MSLELGSLRYNPYRAFGNYEPKSSPGATKLFQLNWEARDCEISIMARMIVPNEEKTTQDLRGRKFA